MEENLKEVVYVTVISSKKANRVFIFLSSFLLHFFPLLTSRNKVVVYRYIDISIYMVSLKSLRRY